MERPLCKPSSSRCAITADKDSQGCISDSFAPCTLHGVWLGAHEQIELLKLRIEECEAAAKDASARFEAQTIEVTDLESKVQAMGKALDAAEERQGPPFCCLQASMYQLFQLE